MDDRAAKPPDIKGHGARWPIKVRPAWLVLAVRKCQNTSVEPKVVLHGTLVLSISGPEAPIRRGPEGPGGPFTDCQVVAPIDVHNQGCQPNRWISRISWRPGA